MPKNQGKPLSEVSIRQRILNHLPNIKGDFNAHDFAFLKVPNNSISVAFRCLARYNHIHLIEKKTSKNTYRVGPPPLGQRIETLANPLDRADLFGWRELEPWLFNPTNLPKGKLQVIKHI